jgi:maltooligosyltrehalose trehalohydrolase
VHHALHFQLSGETDGYYADFARPGALEKVLERIFFHDGRYSTFRQRTHGRPIDRSRVPGSRFVASLQTHDQVGNRARGDRLSATVSPGLLACGAALLLTGAATPTLFMGEEWGASTPWMFFTDHTDPQVADAVRAGRRAECAAHGWNLNDVPDPQAPATFVQSRLDWGERDAAPHARLLAWYRALISLRREYAALRDPRFDLVQAELDAATHTIIVERGASHLVIANLSRKRRRIDLRQPGFDVLLAWDAASAVDGTSIVLVPESAAILAASDEG